MKLITVLVSLIVTISSYSQEASGDNLNGGEVKIDKLPAVVIKRIGKDFSVYLPDRTEEPNVKKLEENFIAYELGKDYEGYSDYLVIMEQKNGKLVATYNEKGKLTSVVEKYENITLPSSIVYSVYKNYPGWIITDDKYIISQEDGNVNLKEYHLKIKKESKNQKLVVLENGKIIN